MDNLTEIASALCIEDPTTEVAHAATATPPYFRLPRELRDQIYDLVALSEEKILYDVTLKAGEQPVKSTVAIGGLSHARSQLRVEYTAALKLCVKSLLFESNLGGSRLSRPGRGQHLGSKEQLTRLEVSTKERAGGELSQSVHTVTIAIPLAPYGALSLLDWTRLRVSQSVAIFAFTFLDTEELGISTTLDLEWASVGISTACFLTPPGYGPLIQKVLCLAKKASWEGSIREHMVWQAYFARYARASRLQ